jgi:hypothetical protein
MSVMTQPLTPISLSPHLPISPPPHLPTSPPPHHSTTPPLRHWIRILKSSQGDRVIGALVEM